MEFEFAWDSSTGVLADLHSCLVGEIVTYPGAPTTYFPPSPPFPALNPGIPNPTIGNVPGSDGGLIDRHHLQGKPFVKPYSSASFITATQYYRYECPCANNGDYVNLDGPISISRMISPTAGVNKWKYVVSKLGSSATIDPLP